MNTAPLLQIVMQPADLAEVEWQDKALCAEVDPEIFYPEKGGSTRDPKRICGMCEVRAECLDYALTHEDAGRFGIWGGTSERERRRLKLPQQRRMCGSGQHPWTEENIYVSPDGMRACRPCRTASCRKTRAAASLTIPQYREPDAA